MIKRQFYSLEHRSRDSEASSASSSSSSSAALEGAACSSADDEAQSPAHEQEEEKDDDQEEASSPGPSFEGSDEDKGATASNPDLAAGNEDDHAYDVHPRNTSKKKKKTANSRLSNQWADLVEETLNEQVVDFADECVVSCKKVLKCRLCTRTICLSRESMQAHLTSKKHARSLKLLSEGRLKVMLNSDGEEEEQGETHAERHSRILASFEEDTAKLTPPKRKGTSGRQRQRKRAKKKAKKSADV